MHNIDLFPKSSSQPPRSSHSISKRNLRLLEIVLLTLAIVLVGAVILSATTYTASPQALANADQSDFNQFRDAAQRYVLIGSQDAFRTLIQSFRQSEPMTHRNEAIQLVATASSPNVLAPLVEALKDNDSGVRAGAAQALGIRHEYSAVSALTDATHDGKAQVRREAIRALVQLDAWQALPRINQLLVYELQDDVRSAARTAKQAFKEDVAFALGIPVPQVRDISVTSSNDPKVYAATNSDFYIRQGSNWQRVSTVPDVPTALATGSDENLVYLATQNLGLYRTTDAGKNWEHVQFGMQTPTQLTVTAVAIDPTNSQQIYIALASLGAEPNVKTGMGAFWSSDGGQTFSWLEDTPMQVITTGLTLDPVDPETKGYLLGIADDTPWRFKLP